ncbi:hypothetical protein HK104_010336 [Borealophlyctis nickersoniae]|nr:hypothetical protein HK104_010336 [Borealophlyctis nickersoniae]
MLDGGVGESDKDASVEELATKLKETLGLLKDRERGAYAVSFPARCLGPYPSADIVTAAQIGQHLLEKNKALEAAYQALLSKQSGEVHFQADAMLRAKPVLVKEASTSAETLNDASLPLPTLSRTLVSPPRACFTSPLSPASQLPFLHRKPRPRRSLTPPSTSRSDTIEYILNLERANHDLETQLVASSSALREATNSHAKKVAALERDADEARAELQKTLERLETLERERRKERKQRRENDRERWANEGCDMDLIQELRKKIFQLEEEVDRLTAAKETAEKRLEHALRTLEDVESRCNDLQSQAVEYEQLRDAYGKQCSHVEELMAQLEEERNKCSALTTEMAAIGGSPSSTSPKSDFDNISRGSLWSPVGRRVEEDNPFLDTSEKSSLSGQGMAWLKTVKHDDRMGGFGSPEGALIFDRVSGARRGTPSPTKGLFAEGVREGDLGLVASSRHHSEKRTLSNELNRLRCVNGGVKEDRRKTFASAAEPNPSPRPVYSSRSLMDLLTSTWHEKDVGSERTGDARDISGPHLRKLSSPEVAEPESEDDDVFFTPMKGDLTSASRVASCSTKRRLFGDVGRMGTVSPSPVVQAGNSMLVGTAAGSEESLPGREEAHSAIATRNKPAGIDHYRGGEMANVGMVLIHLLFDRWFGSVASWMKGDI